MSDTPDLPSVAFNAADRAALLAYHNDNVFAPPDLPPDLAVVPFVRYDTPDNGTPIEPKDVPFWLLKAPTGRYWLIDIAVSAAVVLPTIEDALTFLTVRSDPHRLLADEARVAVPVIDIRMCPTIPSFFGLPAPTA